MNGTKCVINGIQYESIRAAFKACGSAVSYDRVTKRVQNGWGYEAALTIPASRGCLSKDHLGNIYKTQTEMLNVYKISMNTFITRLKLGWSIKRALTTAPVRLFENKVSKDHLGNVYQSKNEMCRHYKISRPLFNYRIAHHYTLEQALTAPIIPKKRAIKK